uniref:Uncharacterized protein n=1 Tax=Nelumbo nucifera TaxID=4432 RepID=A0A822XYB5_NELNU|nr:TPA_asm: hypothetical protein HUJ06_025654 [Nelumbo nucifera]
MKIKKDKRKRRRKRKKRKKKRKNKDLSAPSNKSVGMNTSNIFETTPTTLILQFGEPKEVV